MRANAQTNAPVMGPGRGATLASHGPWTSSRPGRLSYLAFRTATREGPWIPRVIEGRVPREISGALYRNGPGQKETFDVPLGHFFDGDAYLTAIRFDEGRVSGVSRFVATSERIHEQKYRQMRYHEFGTRCPGRALGFKNPPNVNVFAMAGGHFALSEGAPPVQFEPETLACQGARDFGGSWPARTTFTAHPKRDPATGDVYAYGLTMALSPELVLARLPAGETAFQTFARVRVGNFYPVHDFMITKTYVILALPPVYINMWGMLRGRSCIAKNIVAERGKPLRIIVARKDGQGQAVIVESEPASMIFHHCNAVESADGNTIRLISMETDASAFQMLGGWGGAAGLEQPRSQMTEFVIDLKSRSLSRAALTENGPIEFPAIDNRQLGRKMGAIYALRTLDATDDPLAFDTLMAWDGAHLREVRARRGQVFGEAVALVDRTGRSWISHLGYDSEADETFLDIRAPEGLDLVARIRFGFRIPLGFHGCFAPSADALLA
ncbi:carotenoid cleavage dioxygenase-like enzyme [Rhodoblastus acidophilus]|uniref:carotenoid oxygenase family protein n=1 Tax=Rhodoblastus acidophilus TaxID=1074 RepID=UPI0022243BC3|nr:carotenoid oxygenase family protein [Rhodoblastus acidophilus]MCW2317954.1 carotenoid cleavage dioxygenase-like enzyme [Rhodoblastus acidophilus]